MSQKEQKFKVLLSSAIVSVLGLSVYTQDVDASYGSVPSFVQHIKAKEQKTQVNKNRPQVFRKANSSFINQYGQKDKSRTYSRIPKNVFEKYSKPKFTQQTIQAKKKEILKQQKQVPYIQQAHPQQQNKPAYFKKQSQNPQQKPKNTANKVRKIVVFKDDARLFSGLGGMMGSLPNDILKKRQKRINDFFAGFGEETIGRGFKQFNGAVVYLDPSDLEKLINDLVRRKIEDDIQINANFGFESMDMGDLARQGSSAVAPNLQQLQQDIQQTQQELKKSVESNFGSIGNANEDISLGNLKIDKHSLLKIPKREFKKGANGGGFFSGNFGRNDIILPELPKFPEKEDNYWGGHGDFNWDQDNSEEDELGEKPEQKDPSNDDSEEKPEQKDPNNDNPKEEPKKEEPKKEEPKPEKREALTWGVNHIAV